VKTLLAGPSPMKRRLPTPLFPTVKGSFLRSVTSSSTAKTQSKFSFYISESSPRFPDDRGGSNTGKKICQVRDHRRSGRCVGVPVVISAIGKRC